ncbi:TIGR03032 family protein [Nitrospirillum sp. BR 11752]|uniref:TIGR03032 family protein n=1 Tax=Nitrospirillum sp. BR 11752 TaxID=3104293 RepID=UPI002ECE4969|nr:TIGR03032 family protein [Nitrospirillum sp. BR 11752]
MSDQEQALHGASTRLAGADTVDPTLMPTQDGEAVPRFLPSPDFANWLAQTAGSLVLSTYQSGRLIFLYVEDGQLQVLDRVVGTAMGLALSSRHLWVGTREQVWKFANTGVATVDGKLKDAVYMPRKGYFVGPCDTHDVLADVRFGGETHELAFISTAFSCIAALDERYNFRPLWKPDFVPMLVTADFCHLNGFAARDGAIAYATLCGRTVEPGGWRQNRNAGGMVWDLAANEPVATGMGMPHSPRWYRDRLWVLNSAAGQFGYVDGDRGGFVAVVDCPGFARGLTFVGDYAVIGLSQLRANSFGAGMALTDKLQQSQVKQRCGLQIVDLRTGRNAHWLTITGPVTELYDVAFNPGVRHPYSPGFREPALHQQRVHLPLDSRFPHPYSQGVQPLATKPQARREGAISPSDAVDGAIATAGDGAPAS